jgi:hypothetical protein
MTLNIPPLTQFACVAIQPLSLSDQLPQSFQFEPGLYALIKPSFEIEGFWQEQLGKIKSEIIAKSELLVISLTSSDRSDGWFDRELRHYASSIVHSLYMHRVYCSGGGVMLCGGKAGETISIRSVQDLDPYVRNRMTTTKVVDFNILERVRRTAEGSRRMYADKERYGRLKRGFEAWVEGKGGRRDDKRIRQFVRAIEAVVKPEAGKTRRQFVHRAQLFVGSANSSREMLQEIYDLRSCAEHLNDVRSFYEESPIRDIDRQTALRAFEAELIADHVYQRIFNNSDLQRTFIDDSSIDLFWKKPEHERQTLWGATPNLASDIARYFYPFARG